MTPTNEGTMQTNRKRRRVLAAAAVAAACAIGTPVALGVGGDSGGGGYSGDVGDAKVEAARAAQAAAEPAPLPEPFPLTGEGENMELVANVPIDFGADIELGGDYAYVSTYGTCGGASPPIGTPPPGNCTPGTGGLTVIDISDPEHPERVGLFDCAGGQNDVQLSPDGKWAAMAIESRNNACHPGEEGSVVLSLADPGEPGRGLVPADPQRPRDAGRLAQPHAGLAVPLHRPVRGRATTGSTSSTSTDPANPVKLPGVQYGPPQFGSTSPHDLIVDHRPDGKDYVYASSGNQTSDVIDVTDPANAVVLQRLVDPAVDFAHQSEPSHDRKLTLITDEYRGGGEARACGKTGTQDGPRDVPVDNDFGDRNNLGALYFYETGADGLVVPDANGQPKIAGTYNLPLQTGANNAAEGCTIHIYWQAPDENRFVVSWYGKGSRVVDFANPKRAKELGWFVPTGADTWSAKPHNGYIFTGDIARGLRRAAVHRRGRGAVAVDRWAGRGPAGEEPGRAGAGRRDRHGLGAQQPRGDGRADGEHQRGAAAGGLGQRPRRVRRGCRGAAPDRGRDVPQDGGAGALRTARRAGDADHPQRRGRDRVALSGQRGGRAAAAEAPRADHRGAGDLPLRRTVRGPQGGRRPVRGGRQGRGRRAAGRQPDAGLPDHPLST